MVTPRRACARIASSVKYSCVHEFGPSRWISDQGKMIRSQRAPACQARSGWTIPWTMPNRPSSVSTAGSGARVVAFLGSAANDGAVGNDVKRTMAASNARSGDLDCIRTPAMI